MFRNKIFGAMMLGLSGAAVAATDAPAPSVGATTAGAPVVRILDTGRYVQTQLDWRSYYLNRLGAPRQDDRPAVLVSAPPALDNGS